MLSHSLRLYSSLLCLLGLVLFSSGPARAVDTNLDGLDEVAVQQGSLIRFLDGSGTEVSNLQIPETTNLSNVTRIFPAIVNFNPAAILVREQISKSSTNTQITIITDNNELGTIDLGRTDKTLYVFDDIDGSGTFDTVTVNIQTGAVQVYYDDTGISVSTFNTQTAKIKAIHTVVSVDGTPHLATFTGSGKSTRKSRKKSRSNNDKLINLMSGESFTPATKTGFTADIFNLPRSSYVIERQSKSRKTVVTTIDLMSGAKTKFSDSFLGSMLVPGKYIANSSPAQAAIVRGATIEIIDLLSGETLTRISVPNLSGGTSTGTGGSGGSGSIGNGSGGGSGSSPENDARALELLAELQTLLKDFNSGKISPNQLGFLLSTVLPELDALISSGTLSEAVEQQIFDGLQNLGGRSLAQRSTATELLASAVLNPRRILNPDGSPGICSQVTTGSRGFLWKPVSDKDGKGVILSNEFPAGTKIYNDKGKQVLSTQFVGASNARLYTLRLSSTPPSSFWIVSPSTGRCLRISNRTKRYEVF